MDRTYPALTTAIVSAMKELHNNYNLQALDHAGNSFNTVEDIPAVMGTGVSGIALSGAILGAPDPVEMTARIIETIDHR